MNEWSFDELAHEILSNRDARVAAAENDLRRKLASAFNEVRTERELSIRAMADELGTSLSQVQRLLHVEQGGSLTLRTVCRAADALGLKLTIHVRPSQAEDGKVVRFGEVAWNHASVGWVRESTSVKRCDALGTVALSSEYGAPWSLFPEAVQRAFGAGEA